MGADLAEVPRGRAARSRAPRSRSQIHSHAHDFLLNLHFLYFHISYLFYDISAQVRRAHRALALELHPDKLPAEMGAKERDEASRRFIQVQAAYDRLSAQLKA